MLCKCGCGKEFTPKKNMVYYSIKHQKRDYAKRNYRKEVFTVLCKCGCGRTFQTNGMRKFYDKQCQVEYNNALYVASRSQEVLDIKKTMYKIELSLVKIRNSVKSTARMIYFDRDYYDRTWIEIKYPCKEGI